MDTSGFYKLATGGLLFAPNFVNAPGFSMGRDNPDDKIDASGAPVNKGGWQWFDSDAEAYAYWGISPSSPPVNALSRMQAKLELLDAGKLDQVLAEVAAADRVTQIAWAEAPVFERDSPVLNAMAAVVGITQAELDAMFASGKLRKV